MSEKMINSFEGDTNFVLLKYLSDEKKFVFYMILSYILLLLLIR